MDRHSRKVHFKLVRFIIEASIKLHMTSLTQATACRIYHEFYKVCSLGEWDPFLIASTSLYLAGKAEEQHLRIRDIINVTYGIYHRNTPPLDLNNLYYLMRETVSKCELYILRVLGFTVSYIHPHKFLMHYLKSIYDWLPLETTESSSKTNVPIASTAWSLLKDSYHSDICTIYKSESIAISVIYLSLEIHSVEVPYNSEAPTKWWKVMNSNIDLKEIQEISELILSNYDYE